jgi:hypothetical protein
MLCEIALLHPTLPFSGSQIQQFVVMSMLHVTYGTKYRLNNEDTKKSKAADSLIMRAAMLTLAEPRIADVL